MNKNKYRLSEFGVECRDSNAARGPHELVSAVPGPYPKATGTDSPSDTPSIAFRHFPPKEGRMS